jgi:hypothetical protein
MNTVAMQTTKHTKHTHSNQLGSLSAQAESLFIPMLRQRAKQHGMAQLATAVNKNPKVLNNELNPNSTEHKLGFETVIKICSVMNDTSLIRLWASELGLVLFEPPVKKLVDDKELVVCMSGFSKEVGDVAGAIHTALDDFKITTTEVLIIKNEATEAIQSLWQLIHRIEELAE